MNTAQLFQRLFFLNTDKTVGRNSKYTLEKKNMTWFDYMIFHILLRALLWYYKRHELFENEAVYISIKIYMNASI